MEPPLNLIYDPQIQTMRTTIACVAGVNGEREGKRERERKMGFWELGTRERLLQRPPFFHLRPPIFR